MALDSEPFDFFKHTEPNASKGKNTEIIVVESEEVAAIEEQLDDRSDQIEAAKNTEPSHNESEKALTEAETTQPTTSDSAGPTPS
jgi:hypothetical protein